MSKKYQPSSGSDFDGFYASNCEECIHESDCKHIANSMVDDVPFEVDDKRICVHRRYTEKPFVDENQTDLFEEK
jgi:hypothetical protein